jgi:Domain of unknown function (DUF6532)
VRKLTILIQIENALEEWLTGEYKRVPFTSNTYHKKFMVHLGGLEEYAEGYPESSNAWRQKLAHKAR